MKIIIFLKITIIYTIMWIYGFIYSCIFGEIKNTITYKLIDDKTIIILAPRGRIIYNIYATSSLPISENVSLIIKNIIQTMTNIDVLSYVIHEPVELRCYEMSMICQKYIDLDDHKLKDGIKPIWIDHIKKYIERSDQNKIDLLNCDTYNIVTITSENYKQNLL